MKQAQWTHSFLIRVAMRGMRKRRDDGCIPGTSSSWGMVLTLRGRYEKHGEWWESSSARQTGGKRMKSYTLTAWLKHNPLRYHRIPKVS